MELSKIIIRKNLIIMGNSNGLPGVPEVQEEQKIVNN